MLCPQSKVPLHTVTVFIDCRRSTFLRKSNRILLYIIMHDTETEKRWSEFIRYKIVCKTKKYQVSV